MKFYKNIKRLTLAVLSLTFTSAVFADPLKSVDAYMASVETNMKSTIYIYDTDCEIPHAAELGGPVGAIERSKIDGTITLLCVAVAPDDRLMLVFDQFGNYRTFSMDDLILDKHKHRE